jgi:hypothetical protein
VWGLGKGLITPHYKKPACYKCHIGPRTWTESLAQPKQQRKNMSFGISGASCGAGLLKSLVGESAKLAPASRPALGPTQPPIQWVPGVLSPGV